MGLCPSSNLFQPSCSKGCYSSPTNTHSSTLTHCFHCSLFYSPLSLPQKQVSAVQVMLHKVGGRRPLTVRTSGCVKPPVTPSHSHKHTTSPHIFKLVVALRACRRQVRTQRHSFECVLFFISLSSVAAAYSDADIKNKIKKRVIKGSLEGGVLYTFFVKQS